MAVWQIITVIKLLVLLLWPLTLSAAVITIQDPFQSITGLHVLIMLSISTLSGVTTLTLRIDNELRYAMTKNLPRPFLFVSSHMLGSWLAGILAFSLSQHNDFSVWWQIGIVITASFSGARFVEKMSNLYIVKNILKDKD